VIGTIMNTHKCPDHLSYTGVQQQSQGASSRSSGSGGGGSQHTKHYPGEPSDNNMVYDEWSL
jgi:hypothetical protein